MSDTYSGGGAAQNSTAQGSPVEGARETLAQAGQAVREEAAHFAEAAKGQATEKLETQKESVGQALSDFAEVIRKAGDDLGERDQGFAARMVAQAADGLQSFSRTIVDKRPEDMLHAVRDFGRANPTAFVAGAILAGVALGRFARSSAQHEHGSAPTGGGDASAEPDPGVALDTYETPGAADPYAVDLASGFGAADGATAVDTGQAADTDAGLVSPSTPQREV